MKSSIIFLLSVFICNFFYSQNGYKNSVLQTYDDELKEDIYNIPIVFHIVHDSLKEGDYLDSNFKSFVEILNNRINVVDTSKINNQFKEDVAIPNIKFYLPVIDEDCNPVDNISWHYTKRKKILMHLEDIPFFRNKSKGYLDSKKFLNVWLCNITNDNSGASAYRSLRFALDGIVMDIDILKSEGASFLLIHEIGHWLGLNHIWGNTPYFLKGDCDDDDGIDDTPKQKGANIRTDVPGEFCDEGITNHQNFMDYSYDIGMFTHGQKKAMRNYIYNKRLGTLWKTNCNNTSELTTGFTKDTRDYQLYKWVQIGNQKWLAENLNHKTSNSKCYDNKETNCTIYGRLYNWDDAKSACPTGWRLPNYNDWKQLTVSIGNNQNSIRSEQGWLNNKNGTNTTGFNLLPSGYKSSYSKNNGLGKTAKLWLSDSNGRFGYSRQFGGAYGYSSIPKSGQLFKEDLASCRCIQGVEKVNNSSRQKDKTNSSTPKRATINNSNTRKSSPAVREGFLIGEWKDNSSNYYTFKSDNIFNIKRNPNSITNFNKNYTWSYNGGFLTLKQYLTTIKYTVKTISDKKIELYFPNGILSSVLHRRNKTKISPSKTYTPQRTIKNKKTKKKGVTLNDLLKKQK